MPLTVPAATARIGNYMAEFVRPGSPTQQRFLRRIAKELRPEVRQMYRFGVDPFGDPWVLNADGTQPYKSNKMGNAIRIETDRGDAGCLQVFYLVDWIRTADEGHVWPARQVDANRQYLSFNRRGRLVREGSLFFRRGKKAGQQKAGTYQTFARAHTVGQRVLPARPQEPHGRMPQAWGEAINRGTINAFRDGPRPTPPSERCTCESAKIMARKMAHRRGCPDHNAADTEWCVLQRHVVPACLPPPEVAP